VLVRESVKGTAAILQIRGMGKFDDDAIGSPGA